MSVTVMIVDDHEMFVQGLVASLAAEEAVTVVATASTGHEALDALETVVPDVLVLDHVLPDADGVQVARKALEEHPGIKVILLTQLVDEVTAERAISAGCAGYVTKDKPVAELIGAIKGAAAGETAISPQLLSKVLERMRAHPKEGGAKLSPREGEILVLLAEGLTTDAIAARLALSISTVRNHTQSILTKLGAHSQLEAVAIALREGLIRPPRPARRPQDQRP